MATVAGIAFVVMLLAGISELAHPQSVERTVEFSGWTWVVRRSDGFEGPGPNRFLDNQRTVWLDDRNNLHLKVWVRNNRAYTAEVILGRPLGYGTYIVESIGRMDTMDPEVIFGMFTYDDDPAHAHREIDIEYGRFGDPSSPNAQFVVQPFENDENRFRYALRQEGDYLTHAFRWDESGIRFAAFHGHVADAIIRDGISSLADDQTIAAWDYPGEVPPPGNERFRINLWLYQSALPDGDHEVALASFAFVPAGDFESGAE
jgi:hypothetical protein